ncbi:MAG: type II toxin-antitoxin system RelE/ParE family toxin [Alphaproteobacteria bacterium]
MTVRFIVEIRSFSHRGLKRFVEDNDARALRRDLVGRIRRIVTALILAPNENCILGPPGWRIHQLAGDRAGTWSISVSGNWRITFRIDEGEIVNLNLEDYH